MDALRLVLLSLCIQLAAAGSNQLLDTVRKAGDLYRQGKHQEAEKAATEALSMIETRRDPPDFDLASSLNNLGSLLYAQGELDRPEQLFQRSREAYLSLAGAVDPRLATVLYNLAGVYVEKGGYAAAEPLYREALAIREQALGSSHPMIAEVWNSLGFLLLQQRKYNEAEGWLEKASNLWGATTGSEAFAAVALNNLAFLRRLQGHFDQSEALYKRALAAEENHFGQEHPEVAIGLMSLGALYQARGKLTQAAESYRQALVLLEKTLGAQDPFTIEARARLSELTGKTTKPAGTRK